MQPLAARGRLFTAVAIAALLVGCSGAPVGGTGPALLTPSVRPTNGATGGSTDFCSVFTNDKLSAIVGAAVHVGDISQLAGAGCRWDTADGKGGVVILHSPLKLGYGDIAADTGQQPVSGIGDQATIGPAAFYGVSPDGPFDGTIAAAVVGGGFYSVLIAPPPAHDAVVGLLRDFVASGL
jgi:hypothetical protein